MLTVIYTILLICLTKGQNGIHLSQEFHFTHGVKAFFEAGKLLQNYSWSYVFDGYIRKHMSCFVFGMHFNASRNFLSKSGGGRGNARLIDLQWKVAGKCLANLLSFAQCFIIRCYILISWTLKSRSARAKQIKDFPNNFIWRAETRFSIQRLFFKDVLVLFLDFNLFTV